jgi:hypothetical protein
MYSKPNPTPSHQSGILYRHGDVLLRPVDRLPPQVQPRSGAILAHGELTGHSHRIQQTEAVQLWVQGNNLFLEVKQPKVTLIHEEHRSIDLSQGFYQVWRQREYHPEAYVEVAD